MGERVKPLLPIPRTGFRLRAHRRLAGVRCRAHATIA
jgi:hypothetical protein